MKVGRPAEKQMIAYLLGELSEPELLNFEQSCLEDDNFFEELLAVEAELTDDYVSGVLVGARHEAFQQRSLQGANRAKIIGLSELITRQRSARRDESAVAQSKRKAFPPWSWLATPWQWFGLPLATTAVLVIAIGLGFLLWKKQQPKESTGNVAQLPKSSVTTPNATLPKLEDEQKPALQAKRSVVIATFLITGGGERDSGSVNEIRIPPGTDRLQFRLDLGSNDHTRYQASLKGIDSERVRTLDDVRIAKSKAGTTLWIELTPGTLPEGDSLLTVSGGGGDHAAPEVIGRYFVRRTK
jgi:hypothetical protein